MTAHGDQITMPADYTDRELHEAAKMLLDEVADSPLMRMATVRTAAMLVAAFAIELPDPRAAVQQMADEFRTDVEGLLDVVLGAPSSASAN